jgi:4-amino-4-deoxy-L-arabinose transferase-like glycosyltransferase
MDKLFKYQSLVPKSPKKRGRFCRIGEIADTFFNFSLKSHFPLMVKGCILAQLHKQVVVKQYSNSLAISNRLGLTLWLIIFGSVFAWRTQNLDAFGLSNDEGAHLMWARLAVEGYPLYQETQAVQAPLFIESVGWAFRLAGQTIQAGRWVTLLGFGLLAVALSWLGYQAGGWPASLTALLLVGISPLIFTFSRLVMAEVTAIALAVVAVALIFPFYKRGQRGWLGLSGIALGLSFIVKALSPFVIVPIGFLLLMYRSQARSVSGLMRLIVSPGKRWQAMGGDFLYWGAGLCLPLALVLFIYDPAALYDQLVAFRGDLRAAVPGSWSESGQHFWGFISSHWGFWLLALGGVISILLSGFSSEEIERGKSGDLAGVEQGATQASSAVLYNLTWGLWLMAGMTMLAWHTPLFPHHFVVLLPPLILLGAGLVTNLAVFWAQRGNAGGLAHGLAVALSAIIVVAGFNGPAIVQANQATAAAVTGGREQEALQLLEAVSNPADFLMGDSQLLIFMANRRTPPPLGDVALVAIKTRRQTATRMIGLTERYQSPAVVQWSMRLPWLPEYVAWVEANYLRRRVWDNNHIIYFSRRLPEGYSIPNERLIRLGDSLALRGFQLEIAPLLNGEPFSNGAPLLNDGRIQAGRDLNLKVYWQANKPLANDYTIFTQVLDEQGALVAGRDAQPLGGYFPTSQWPAGEIVTDVIRVPLPANLPAGEYALITGMYLLETLERLSASNGAGDYVKLTTITVE